VLLVTEERAAVGKGGGNGTRRRRGDRQTELGEAPDRRVEVAEEGGEGEELAEGQL
jgi:hypothetical protein